ncbi:MAG: hypothetical protein CM15mP62_18260 [Rhodospirillaceae bacterium]|nr:MAG: hypothetical protein CM15mP62_18260 [Rhodospirillaceae bacterium]
MEHIETSNHVLPVDSSQKKYPLSYKHLSPDEPSNGRFWISSLEHYHRLKIKREDFQKKFERNI